MTRDAATVLIHPIETEATGRTVFTAVLAPAETRIPSTKCPHRHRTIQAAARCGETMRRQLPN